MLTARDFTFKNQRRRDLVELGYRGCRLARAEREALDCQAALEDLLKVLQYAVNGSRRVIQKCYTP